MSRLQPHTNLYIQTPGNLFIEDKFPKLMNMLELYYQAKKVGIHKVQLTEKNEKIFVEYKVDDLQKAYIEVEYFYRRNWY